ncbi:MAG: FAD-dependent oxidoreductase, partial [Caldimonas sp.]
MRSGPTGLDFLAAVGAPACWQRRQRFVILDHGFGDGARFLAAWSAWRGDPARSASLHFIAIEPAPSLPAELGVTSADVRLAPLIAQLIAAWPPHTSGLHRLAFEGGAIQLLLLVGDIAGALPKLHAEVDAFFIATSTGTQGSCEDTRRLCKALARLAGPGASVTLAEDDVGARDALRAAGFTVTTMPGGADADPRRTFTMARFAPRHRQPDLPRRAASRAASVSSAEPVVIVGAGLAGCAIASALAEQGRTSVVFDRRDRVAAEASGNAAGLFHGVVHRADGRHARWHRAAALAAHAAVSRALAQGVRGSVGGLLRLEPEATDRRAMQDTI